VPEPEEVARPDERSVGEAIQRFDDEDRNTGTPGWVSLADAAAAVGVSPKTIRRAVKAGTIDGQRADGSPNAPWLVPLEDVEARWGDKSPTPSLAGDQATAQPLQTSAEPANAAEFSEVETHDQSGETEASDQPLQGRLSELRKRLVIEEPRRRWWQRPNR